MGLGERNRLVALALTVAGLIVLLTPQLAVMLSPAPDRPTPVWSLCERPDRCQSVDVSDLSLDAPVTTLRTVFVADRAALTSPQAVHIAATASAEVWWNGERIGTNGQVGPDRTREVPGRFSAVIPVPQDRIRPGENIVEVWLSSHHLWAPIRRPIHELAVGPHSDPLRGTLSHYLPTLLLIGLLALAFVGAAVLWGLRRGPCGAAALTLLSGAVLAQAAVEASKLVLTYAYPWQLARLATVAGLAALVLGLGATPLIPDRRQRLWVGLGLAAALAVALFGPPWWDAKAAWAFRAGVFTALLSAGLGAVGGERRARWVQIACVAVLALSWSAYFLDGLYYLLFLILFGVLAVRVLRRPATAPATPSPDQTLSLPNGASRHLIRAERLLHVRADDDYSLVTLTDGRELLSTANLAALIALAEGRLLRIHRSHAVNPAHIVAVHRSGREGHTVELTDGLRLPVGRTRRAAVEALLG